MYSKEYSNKNKKKKNTEIKGVGRNTQFILSATVYTLSFNNVYLYLRAGSNCFMYAVRVFLHAFNLHI